MCPLPPPPPPPPPPHLEIITIVKVSTSNYFRRDCQPYGKLILKAGYLKHLFINMIVVLLSHIVFSNLQQLKKTPCKFINFIQIISACFVCDVTLSVYPHRASFKNMPGHGGNRTYDLCNTSPQHQHRKKICMFVWFPLCSFKRSYLLAFFCLAFICVHFNDRFCMRSLLFSLLIAFASINVYFHWRSLSVSFAFVTVHFGQRYSSFVCQHSNSFERLLLQAFIYIIHLIFVSEGNTRQFCFPESLIHPKTKWRVTLKGILKLFTIFC